MIILYLLALVIIIFGVANYDKMSYKKFYERSVVNSKHPDWTPKCGINFLEKDPQWFIDNGYEKWVR